MIDVHDLAKLALETLDQQQRYFKSRRQEDLVRSKALEKELRSRANKALQNEEPKNEQREQDLFG